MRQPTYTASPVPQSFRKIDNIPLSPIIYCPTNLQEYVEAIQSQLSVPLNMVFSSEKIAIDFMTGEYQAGLKPK